MPLVKVPSLEREGIRGGCIFNLNLMIIGIGGSGSGSGKTTMAEELLKALVSTGGKAPAWGVIKFTKTAVYTSVTADSDILLEEGKDTARMQGAGAAKAVWVQSPGGEELSEALSIAIRDLESCRTGGHGPLKGVIVEGNSAIELLKPDIVIFMSGPVFKSGAERALREADVIYRPRGARHAGPAEAGKNKGGAVFCSEIGACVREVLKLIYEREAKGL